MIISIDDGCASDVRMAELLTKYNIEGIFYWPVEITTLALEHGYQPLKYDEALAISRLFEIGSHTITHRHLTKLSSNDAIREIVDSKFILEALYQTEVTKFCPPRGYTNPQLTEETLAFYDSQRLTKGKHLVHIHPDSGANDNKPWRECITDDTTELWCHSWELDKYNLWHELEDYLRTL